MKTHHLNLSILILFLITVSCGNNSSDYSKTLKSSVDKMMANQVLTEDELLSIIPNSQEDFLEYYSYTYPEKDTSTHKVFYQIDNLIIKNTTENRYGFLQKYLELAKFVDGEYAESYAEESEFIISKNPTIFCGLYDNLSQRAKEFFEDQYLEYCKDLNK